MLNSLFEILKLCTNTVNINEVLTAVTMKVNVLWDMMPCSEVGSVWQEEKKSRVQQDSVHTVPSN